jgi:hypothetical protein
VEPRRSGFAFCDAQYTIEDDSRERTKRVFAPYLKSGEMRKLFNHDTIHIGEVLGEKEVRITDEMIRTCAQAIESSHPWYFEDSPY